MALLYKGVDPTKPGKEKESKIIDKYQDGGLLYKPKERRGVRKNPDGTVSSHLMAREYVDGKGWVAFPTLFQDSKPYADDSKNWVDMKDTIKKDGWWSTYQEALRRGEVYEFGEDEEAAINFADKGSWKKEMFPEGKK